jgi:hypothetical protein
LQSYGTSSWIFEIEEKKNNRWITRECSVAGVHRGGEVGEPLRRARNLGSGQPSTMPSLALCLLQPQRKRIGKTRGEYCVMLSSIATNICKIA